MLNYQSIMIILNYHSSIPNDNFSFVILYLFLSLAIEIISITNESEKTSQREWNEMSKIQIPCTKMKVLVEKVLKISYQNISCDIGIYVFSPLNFFYFTFPLMRENATHFCA